MVIILLVSEIDCFSGEGNEDQKVTVIECLCFHNTVGGDSNSQHGNDCDVDNGDTNSGIEMLAVIVVVIMLKMVFNMVLNIVFNMVFNLVFNMVVTNLFNSFISSRDIPSAPLVWC